MTDDIKELRISLRNRSFEDAANDLENIAKAVRQGALWNLHPGILRGGSSVEMQTIDEPNAEEVDPEADDDVTEPAEAPKPVRRGRKPKA